MRRYLSVGLTLLVLVGGGGYLWANSESLYVLGEIRSVDLAKLFLFTLLFFYVTGYTFARILSLLGIRLTNEEILGLSILTNFGNYLGPIRPGAAIKAVYLKKAKGVAYSSFASIFAANAFVAIFMMGGAGVGLLWILPPEDVDVPEYLQLVCVGLVCISMIPLYIKLPVLTSENRLVSILRNAVEGFHTIRSRKSGLAIISLTFLVQFVVAGLINQTVYIAIGAPITFLFAVAIGVFTSIANLFTITPNNLGVQEVVIAYIVTLAGYDFSTGLVGAALARAVHMAVTFALAPIFSHRLMKNLG